MNNTNENNTDIKDNNNIDNNVDMGGLSGLINFGNTCYMNSAIQCLSNIQTFRDYFLSKEFVDDINKNKLEVNLVVQWYKLMLGMWRKNCTISPQSFRKEIRLLALKQDMNLNFVGNGQNDVQEFILFLINSMHNCLSRRVEMKISGTIKNDLDKKALEAMKSWKAFFKDDYSIFIDLFYSQHSSSIYDLDKNLKSTIYDPICYYTIPIPMNKDNINIYDCLDLYTDFEKMDGDNKWYNEETKEFIDCYKQIKFWNTPKILIIVFKRFLKSGNKKSNYIDFPIKELDLNKYCIGYKKNKNIFDLVCVSNHIGNLNFGHYFAYCKNSENEKWYNYNDSDVTEITEDELISNSAYCLFYQKRE